MKRMIALLLALVLALSLAVPVLASETTSDGANTTPAGTETTAEPTETPEATVEPVTPPGTEATEAPEASPEAGSTDEHTAPPEAEATEAPAEPPEATEAPDLSFEDDPDASPEAEPMEDPEAPASPSPEASPSPSPEADMTEMALISLISSIPASASQVDVTISQALDLGQWPTFQLSLNGAGVFHTVKDAKADGTCYSFHGLEAGEYALTVAGPGFATYTQTIQVGKSDGMLVKLTAGRLAGYDDGGLHPGVLQLGDVNGDGVVDGGDREMMMKAVDGQAVEGYTDLNGDGVTTLADAEYLAKGLDIGALDASGLTASLEHFVPATAIASVAAETTQVVSDVSNLFQDNGTPAVLGTADAQPISIADPVEVTFGVADGALIDGILIEDDENTNIASGTILITYDDGSGQDRFIRGQIGTPVELEPAAVAAEAEAPIVPVTRDADGNFQLDLGTKVAVKRVKLTITGTTDNSSLASISQVEFVNGMKERIPEPAPDTPALQTPAQPGSRQVTVFWDRCVNVTGYEVQISADGYTETIPVTGLSLTVTNFNGKEVRNYTTYTVRARSINGAWASAWSGEVNVTPKPTSKPDKPDNVKAEGGYQTVTVSWKDMKDTTSYDLYYRIDMAAEFTKVPDIKGTSYMITGLSGAKEVECEVYVVGKNEIGESAPSMHATAKTTTPTPAQMPQYNLINRDASGNPGSDHITAAVQTKGTMLCSPLDTGAGTAWGTVDGDAASYYDRRTWDDGGYNGFGTDMGLSYTFDTAYTIDTIGMMSLTEGMDYTYLRVRWWDSAGVDHLIERDDMTSERRTDSAGKTYFFLRLPEPVEATRIQIGTARYWPGNNYISVSEVYFYKYDSLKRDLTALYEDDLHTTLRQDVTEDYLNELRQRIDRTDEFGHAHPDKAQLLVEWETAMKIFKDQFLSRVVKIHDGITASGDDHGFGGLNAWQPLGIVAAAGETVTVYVGHSTMQTGSKTSLQLVITQYHAEANAMSKVLTNLKVGANEVHIPKIWTTSGIESGGALYVQYTGGAGTGDSYAVRVSGGVQVPVLDLYKVSDQGERLNRVSAYLSDLQTYADNIPTLHSQIHQGEGSVSREVDLAYSERDCILGASDIMLDTMMLSLPAQQILTGSGGSAQTLLNSLSAMENMMTLFYQHKGLNANAPNSVDRIPNRHLNIRYQRMFSGAFMYASGDHIGIEWPETAGMANCGGVRTDGNGLYSSGSYFGWGVAHEIGHDINQSSYAIAEITNNYFAVLAQAKDTNDSVRFEYPKVYEKVTSGTRGPASNVFTQLAMYWQLHLAYDKGYNFKTYADYDQQLANLFFARVDTYSRTPERAPAPKGVALTIKGADVDQTLMRLACAAAEKDLLDFFQRWGKTPDETTIAYATQFPEESRAIYYVCDNSRRYTMEHSGPSKLAADGSTPAIASVTVEKDADQANKVNIAVTPDGTVSSEEILGYEIVRCVIAGGKVEKRTVGFTTTGTFSDEIRVMNNRTVSYEVTMVDQYLNRSAAVATSAVKIEHEGDLDKAEWTVATTGLTPDLSDANNTDGKDDMPEGEKEDVALRMTDGKTGTVYNATVGEGACIELDFRDTQVITGFRYTAGTGTPIGSYVVDVRQDGEWLRVCEGELGMSKTVYFPSVATGKTSYISTYSADGLRLYLRDQVGEMISVAELDVLGITGDNVDFHRADGQASIGYLQEAFKYGDAPEDVIPQDSLVFTGSYKGNAAYNVVVLYDQDGKIVTGTGEKGELNAYQIILADVPEKGNILDVPDGAWVYWIQPEDMPDGFVLPKKVRVELYRVNNAETDEGERLVSDSLLVDVPQQPGKITLKDAR